MDSTKCPACGLQNFATAIVCRRCSCPLMGDGPRRARAAQIQRKESFRWLFNGTLVSIAFAVLLFLLVFLFNVIPNAMHSGETGWTDFTSEQSSAMLKWYLTLLGIGVILILTIFYLRRHKYQ